MEKYYERIFRKDDGKHFQVSFAPPQTVLRESKDRNIPHNDFTRQNGNVSLPEKSRLVENSVKSNILSSQMFETDQISDESLYELQENVDRPSNQVDELKQKAPPLHIEFESLANGEYKRPKQNDYHEFQENRRAYGKCNFSPSGRGLF